MTDNREALIRDMAARGMKDREIAAALGVASTHVQYLRTKFGIRAGCKPGGWKGMHTETPAEPPPQPVETYVENGLTVTRYRAMYANGAGVQSVTARGKR